MCIYTVRRRKFQKVKKNSIRLKGQYIKYEKIIATQFSCIHFIKCRKLSYHDNKIYVNLKSKGFIKGGNTNSTQVYVKKRNSFTPPYLGKKKAWRIDIILTPTHNSMGLLLKTLGSKDSNNIEECERGQVLAQGQNETILYG